MLPLAFPKNKTIHQKEKEKEKKEGKKKKKNKKKGQFSQNVKVNFRISSFPSPSMPCTIVCLFVETAGSILDYGTHN